jgi:hypothetical protein
MQALREQVYSYGYGLGAYLAKHLLSRQLPATMFGHGLRHGGVTIGRMRRATEESQLRVVGRRLGFTEARGVIAGALSYYRSSRRVSRVSSGVQ